jgi:DNA-binding GntR family transcriptional regulator
MLNIERPKSLSEEVTAQLRREIVDGTFEMGEALSESMIAARYGVSRTPVREAFAFLGQEGLVRTEPQQGTYVFKISREQFNQLSETRSILETGALELALQRNRRLLLRRWTRIAKAMTAAAESDNGAEYCRLDGEFHETLFVLAGNPHLFEATQSFATKVATVRNRLGANLEHMKHSYKEHVELLGLVERGLDASAKELLDRHIRHKGDSFWAAMEEHIKESDAPKAPVPIR